MLDSEEGEITLTDSKEIFKKRKKIQMLITIVALIAVVLLFVTKLETAALVIVIGLVIFSRFNWKCPKCNRYLGKGTNPKHCIHCGEELQ